MDSKSVDLRHAGALRAWIARRVWMSMRAVEIDAID
jgi:hypothetical protein